MPSLKKKATLEEAILDKDFYIEKCDGESLEEKTQLLFSNSRTTCTEWPLMV